MFGGFLGFGLSFLALTLPFEHPILLWILFWVPLLAVIVGALFGWHGHLPPLRFVLSLALFTLLIGLTVFSHKTKQQYLQLQREKIAEYLIPHYATSIEIKHSYNSGDSFDNEPVLSITYQDETPFEEIEKFYNEKLSADGWKLIWTIGEEGALWRKDWHGIGITKSRDRRSHYVAYIKFWGSWINDISFTQRYK